MTYTRTLTQLDTAVRQLGAWEGSDDITPEVMLQALNFALIEGYDIMVAKWADYYTVDLTFPLVAGTDTYQISTLIGGGLAPDFYKLRHLDHSFDGVRFQRMYPMDLDVAYRYSTASSSSRPPRYRIQNSRFVFAPVPSDATVRMYYIPLPFQYLHIADDTAARFDVPTEERLIVHLAMRDLLVRSDLSTASVDGKIEKLTGMLRTAADSRDAGEPFYLDPNGPPRSALDADEDWY